MPDWLPRRRAKEERAEDAGTWSKCPKCSEVLYRRDLAANLWVCPRCAHHFRMSAVDRINITVDGDFKEIGADVLPGDPLQWVDKKKYAAKLAGDREKSQLSEAVICGTGKIGGFEAAIGVMDFHSRRRWARSSANASRCSSNARANCAYRALSLPPAAERGWKRACLR